MEPVIGLAVGRGTGPELAAVFERVLTGIAGIYATDVHIVRSARTYHSYNSLNTGVGIERIREITRDDADHYREFCRTRAALGTTAVFRTAINAQSLYLVRQALQAVKVDVISGRDASLLLVRDAAQGFYTGENLHVPDALLRTMAFSRQVTEKVIAFAVERARRQWPDGVDEILMAYKFHLLDGALDAWVAESARRHGVTIDLCQPDTVNRNLIERGPRPRTLVIAGNEWADIMHVMLLDRFGAERQENRCTENVYLHPDVAGLTEYQTVHGSADDLEGRDTVNPVATIRAAAMIAERHAGCAGAVRMVERGLGALGRRGIGTPDLGGRHSTTAVVDALIDALEPEDAPVLAGEP
ncbi:isocitrate/isopropylmalate family dehydrogenase [Actinocorallia sp. A-T 12471]|uniref:isocitrate/isopropylmalate family dehydrogenase n=1 Tax=Actinocorallia sp. A-T 12471 TaxID=3089813 RepID=UPI0029CB3A70|nr:isocitrate/isopropylmalate family dehydrogenase [Actinocorallia sp. A-T 12471]MDX6739805.1 isocitrate/isopropylmalate family dehydrogenase [Actinocorallia sp. A-T 12471]